jgi:L-fucose mutarotase
MLRYPLTHPQILGALAAAGHGSQVLLMDGNYPHSTGSNPSAQLVHLNLRPGLPLVTDVLATVLTAIPVESAAVMQPEGGAEAPIFDEFASLLDDGTPITRLARPDFYAAGRGTNVALAIATGEQRWFANILLTIGAIVP